MKGNHPRITLLGSNSGNNLGDAAIMSSILESFANLMPDAEFYVPTPKPEFIKKHYGKRYNVKGVNIMPWTGSVRFIGLPTLSALAKSDIALICDGIIFGKKLWNPAFNFLIVLILIVPLAKMLGCKVICYSCGIGPFPSNISKIFAKWVLNGCDTVIMREHDSANLAREIGVTKPIQVTGDAAFINPVSSDARADEILKIEGIDSSKRILGVNVTAYFDSWLSSNERIADKDSFLSMLAAGLKDANSKLGNDFQVVVFSTHPMDDLTVHHFASMVGGKVILNRTYLSHDIQSVMKECELFIGMRFHSVILASAVETPILGLIYAPKVRGYFRLLGCEEYGLELAEITSSSLSDAVVAAWKGRAELRARQKKVIDELKRGAHNAAEEVTRRYFPERAFSQPAAQQATA